MRDNANDAVKTGESMACLQIAAGIWGVLLLAVPILISFRNVRTMAAVLVLLAGTVFAVLGGVFGLKPGRERQASKFMVAGDLILTFSALVLLIVSFGQNDVNWYFPLGGMFLTLALVSDIASYRFQRAIAARFTATTRQV